MQGRGVYPPVDVLGSLSRLLRLGAGAGRTRGDHPDLAAQLVAAAARARQVHDLADLIGEASLTETDRSYLRFEEAFEREMLQQGQDESRSMEDTLHRAWQVASRLARPELTMLSSSWLDRYYSGPEA